VRRRARMVECPARRRMAAARSDAMDDRRRGRGHDMAHLAARSACAVARRRGVSAALSGHSAASAHGRAADDGARRRAGAFSSPADCAPCAVVRLGAGFRPRR
jgi:hypothetical protein